MERLWAPWRMEYIDDILSKSASGCFLCGLASVKHDDYVLLRGKTCFVMMNRYPYNSGHVMIVPNSHAASLAQLSNDELSEMMRLCSDSVEILRRVLQADGFNCGFNLGKCAGAGVEDHVHMHVVPRWNGDTNFLPVLSDTKSMPEYLNETYKKLKPEFEKMKSERGKR